MKTFVINNIKQTKKLAQSFAKLLVGGEVILLNGDLGAGKTTFTKFVLQALGVKDNITSPTFTLMHEYKTKRFNICTQKTKVALFSLNGLKILKIY